MTRERTVIVLAAGEGKRMKSATPKVLHPLLGRTLLGHVLATVAALRADRCVVVVGNGADEVSAHVAQIAPYAQCVLQAEQLGTGHAARVGLEAIPGACGTVVVINADVPLLRAQTLADLVAAHDAAATPATILTAEVADPTGLGRIIRNPVTGSVEAIVEDRDTTAEQRAITEINVGLYVFDAAVLGPALGKLTTHNDQREEYLPDVVRLLADAGQGVTAVRTPDLDEVRGCNDRVELAALCALLRDRTNETWMRAGVTMIDPATTWIDVTATVGRDVVLEPNTQLRGRTEVADGAVIGPETTLTDTTVGEGATVVRVHAVGARIGARAQVGPFAYLRPGTVLLETAKVGAFVEVKNSQLGAGAKVPHLSYVGDATVGARANLGAGTIVVNYDGQHKHRTTVGEGAFIGCDTSLIAPVEVGPGAYVAAGSVINRKVRPGALGVSRAPQREIAGWVLRRRAGTVSADAAQAALAADAAQAALAADPAQAGSAALSAAPAQAGSAAPAQPGQSAAYLVRDVTSGRAPAAGDAARGDTADG